MNELLTALLLNIMLFHPSKQGFHQKRLLKDLFEVRKYNRMERPAIKDNSTVTVRIAFNVQQIVNVDEREQYLDSSVWIEHYWSDGNLVWNAADYGGISRIRLAPSAIWKPDILMYNSAEQQFDGTWPVNLIVESTGAISYIPPAMLRSICKINIQWFPFDQQYCLMKFGSWTYDADQVNITLSDPSVITEEYIENGEFDLLKPVAKRFDNPFGYGGSTENYPYVALCFHLRRHSLYYYFNLIIPAALISAMALLVFTLPADSGEKIGLSVTILLSLTVFNMVVCDFIPRTSEAVPILGIYFTSILFMCSIAVITSVWVLNLHYYPHINQNPPKWVRYGVCVHLASLLGMSVPPELIAAAKMRTTKKVAMAKKIPDLICRNTNVGNLDTYFTAQDNATVPIPTMNRMPRNVTRSDCCLNVVHQRPRAPLVANCRERDYAMPGFRVALNSYPLTSSSTVYSCMVNAEAERKGSSPNCFNYLHLQLISKELKVLCDKVRAHAEEEKVRMEWCFAARVIDRVCLWFFTSVIISLLLILSLSPPQQNEAGQPPNWPC